MFPLRARDGGVLVRAGQTEAAVDLARIAGLYPAGVICEIMNEDGTMARVPELTRFAKRHKLLMITIADLIQYRMRTEALVQRVASATLPTDVRRVPRASRSRSPIDRETHVALVQWRHRRRRRRAGARALEVPDRRRAFIRRAATAARSSTRRWSGSRPKAAACCCTSTRKGAASASPTRSAPTSCRTRASTRSKPTSGSASRPTSATTASACRFSRDLGVRSDAAAVATTRASWSASRDTGCR